MKKEISKVEEDGVDYSKLDIDYSMIDVVVVLVIFITGIILNNAIL